MPAIPCLSRPSPSRRRSLLCSIMHIHMPGARTFTTAASLLNGKEKEIRKRKKPPRTFERKRAHSALRFALFARVPCFIYQSARTSGCSNGLIMNYFVTRIRHCVYRALSLSLSLSRARARARASIVSAGLTVNSEPWRGVCRRVRARVTKQYMHSWRFSWLSASLPSERNARRSSCRHQDWALSRANQMIVSRLLPLSGPPPAPPRSPLASCSPAST